MPYQKQLHMSEFMLKRRLNPVLLVSTVAALSLLAGLSVIAQDQINERQDRVQQLEQQRSNLNQSVNRLESQLNNETVRNTQLKQNNSRLQNLREQLEGNLSERDNEIDNLSDQLEDAKARIPDVNVTELNASLEEVCFLGEPWNQSDGDELAAEECKEWGHQVES